MAIKYRSINGTNDAFPPQIDLWQCVEGKARELFRRYGYQEIRTPIIEYTELFARSVGADTDIVEKEMYTFTDKSNRSISLRPEETAGVIRAYLEGSLYAKKPLWKLSYSGPMFRRERPQAGRLRQFHQIGAEVIGTYAASADAETIIWLRDYFRMFNLPDPELRLNSAGCQKCRPGYTMLLQEQLGLKIKDMCADCQRRYKRNIFRVLDCKQSQCRKIINGLPVIQDSLCGECREHFEELKSFLLAEKVTFKIDPHLVRGLDYYTRTVYEFISPLEGLGAQNTIAAGGRYDRLVQEMGGPPTGAVGFSIGVERLIMALTQLNCLQLPEDKLDVFLVSLDSESYAKNFTLLNELRRSGIQADINFQAKSVKAQMRLANKLGARYVIVRGEDERNNKIVKLKSMDQGLEKDIKEEEILEGLKGMLKGS